MSSRHLTTVELLQQQRYSQTTAASLKRSAPRYHPPTADARNTETYPLQTIQSNTSPRKRQNAGAHNATLRKENRQVADPRHQPSAAYPTPPPSVSRYSTEVAQGVSAKPAYSSPVTECSLVYFILCLLKVVSS
jgi:hypothetical protein